MAQPAYTPGTLYGPNGRRLRYDAWAGAYDLPHDPLDDAKRSDARIVHRDIPLSDVTGNWSIQTIRNALMQHRQGQFNLPARLCDSVMADDRVQATLGSRTGGLFAQKVIHKEGSGNAYKTRAARRAWKKVWRKACPQSVMSQILWWGIMIGFAIAELRWDTTVTPWQPYVVPWHPVFCEYRMDVRQYQLSTLDGTVFARPGGGKWLVFTPHGAYVGWRQGALRALAEKWFIKQLAWRDWARFNERHGLPILLAGVPAAGDRDQKRNFVTGMSGIGQQSVVGLPQNVDGTGYTLEMLEAKDRAWETFMGCIDRCDRSLVLPILWQNLTTEVKEGALAAARVHGDVRQNAIEFDNETLSECVYRDITRPWAQWNYGDADLAPMTCWDVTPPEDMAVKADIFLKFAQAIQALRTGGVQVDDPEALARTLRLVLGSTKAVDPPSAGDSKVGAAGGKQAETVRQLARAYREATARIADIERRMAA